MPSKALVPLTPAPPPAVPQVPWPQAKARDSEAAIVTISRWARRNNHVSVPLAIPFALWLAGLALHLAHVLLYAALCGAVLAGCVWWFAPHKWDRPAEQWYARLSAMLGALWLILAAWLGPLNGMPGIVLASLLAAGGSTWGWFWWRHKRPRGQRQRDRLLAQCDAWWQSHAWQWNLHGSRVIEAELRGVTLRMRIQGIGGRHAYHHFEQVVPLIESAAEGHADVGLVRIGKVKSHPSQVDLFLKRENPLKGIVEYDPAIAPQSVHDPAPFGRMETGGWKMTGLRQNRFTIGMTRWGKSNDELVGIANLSGCPDARVIVIDLKGGRSARPVLKSAAVEYVITEIDEARMFLRLATAEAKAREMYAYDGNEQLLATTAVPALFTMVDETHGLTATEDSVGDPECRRHVATLASQGSGVEMYVWVYTQHGSLESSVGTEQIRGNLAWRTCYRVAEARHGAYCIPEYNKLDASRLEEKGTCYVKDGPDATPEQVRTPLMAHELLERIAGQNATLLGQRPPLRLYCGEQAAYETADGPVTWQEWWDARWLRLHPAFRDDSPQYKAAAGYAPGTTPDDEMLATLAQLVRDGTVKADDVTADALAKALAIHQGNRGGEPPAAPSPAPAAPVPAADDSAASRLPAGFTPDPRLVGQLGATVAAQEARFAELLQAATMDSPVTPKDLVRESGMSRSWVHDRLSALAETGVTAQVSRGLYYSLPGADAVAGLREIKARNDRLNTEARQMISNAA